MSHAKITIPITVKHVESPGALRPVSLRDYLKSPETAEFRFVPDSAPIPHGPFDPWKLREDFLSWPIEEWEAFVSMAGCFGPFRISQRSFGQWQVLLREALIRPARDWKALESEVPGAATPRRFQLSEPLRIVFAWEGEVPQAFIRTGASLEAIIATIQIDKLTGAQFRVCARHDCKNPPFRVEARHKIFCSSDCAHLVAVRRSRDPAAQAKSKTAKKAPNRRADRRKP